MGTGGGVLDTAWLWRDGCREQGALGPFRTERSNYVVHVTATEVSRGEDADSDFGLEVHLSIALLVRI